MVIFFILTVMLGLVSEPRGRVGPTADYKIRASGEGTFLWLVLDPFGKHLGGIFYVISGSFSDIVF